MSIQNMMTLTSDSLPLLSSLFRADDKLNVATGLTDPSPRLPLANFTYPWNDICNRK